MNRWPLPYQGSALPLSYMGKYHTTMERVAGIEPACSAWKADVLPLNYTRALYTVLAQIHPTIQMVEGGGFEPPKAEPSDLQSDPFGRSGTPPMQRR